MPRRNLAWLLGIVAVAVFGLAVSNSAPSREKDRDYDAERLLSKAREATDNDARVARMWEDVTILRHEKRVKLAEQEVAREDNEATQAAPAAPKSEMEIQSASLSRTRNDLRPESGLAKGEKHIREVKELRGRFVVDRFRSEPRKPSSYRFHI